ncbi:BON domain-containing protein [Deinococcus sp. Marseille-Q6407]|uniref:BON domain-containing protein n=1 Tax=Deinococcus sp. Marseille-Q6407 TaxID=2969223 RepID=UPI0021BE6EE4|nr:BON domain-containing protein [Deinococcus sp. Marseille-Q6407]
MDASEVEVQVEGGEVTLSGTVNDRWQKRQAESCAERVRGIRDVHNRLRVQPAGGNGPAGSDRDQSQREQPFADNATGNGPTSGSAAESGHSASAASTSRASELTPSGSGQAGDTESQSQDQ